MLEKVIRELGSGAYARVIEPLKRMSLFDGLILGFDTEYESKGSRPVCFQLSDGGARGVLRPGRVTVEKLGAECVRTFGSKPGDEVYLVCFFSIAELQFLPVKGGSFNMREYGSGSLDCSFFDEEHEITLHVFDVARFFERQGLAAVAEAFGLQKLEWNRKKVTRADLRSKNFREYALHDAWLCARIMQHLRTTFEPWSVDPIREKTAASCASSVFRRGWVSKTIGCENDRARTAGMRACWGGRAEAFARGSFAHLTELDLSSAYPRAAIALGILPTLASWKECRSLRSLDRLKHGLAHVRFRWPKDELYPSLPMILPEAQVYVLEGQEWVTFDEVRAALDAGCHVEIVEAWGYSKGTTILRDYMQEMLERREKAKGAERVAYKLLANALIGKFAQRVSDIDIEEMRKAAETAGVPMDDLGRMSREELEALGVTAKIRVGSVFMPEWNALITGHVRARLGVLIRNTEAVYAATDAVWTAKPPSRLPSDLQVKRAGPAIIARTRFGVIFDDPKSPHVAHHSVWTRQAGLRVLKDLDGPPKKYALRRPIKLRESMRAGRRFGEWVQEFRIADAFWDNKRELLPDGKSTRPWPSLSAFQAGAAAGRAERKARARSRASVERDD
jgi:hypothetical protein